MEKLAKQDTRFLFKYLYPSHTFSWLKRPGWLEPGMLLVVALFTAAAWQQRPHRCDR